MSNAYFLCDVLAVYFLHNLRIRSEHTRDQYRYAIAAFGAAIKKKPSIDDFTDDNVRVMMRWIVEQGRSPVTANDRRIQICALWSWCARRGIVQHWPTVEMFVVPRRIPRAWSEDQLKALMQSCLLARGKIGGIPAPLWWLSFHALQWDSGGRTSELLTARWENFDAGRQLLYIPAESRKGQRKDALYALMPDTVEMLLRINVGHPLILPGIGCPSAFYKRYNTILERAGLPTDRRCKPQKMRVSHASWLKHRGGDATASLMHESDSTTRRSYLDPSVCDSPPAARLFRILPDSSS
jgi:integrase